MPSQQEWLKVRERRTGTSENSMLIMVFYRKTLICGHCPHVQKMENLDVEDPNLHQILFKKHLKTHRRNNTTKKIYLIQEDREFETPSGCRFDKLLFEKVMEKSPDFKKIQKDFEKERERRFNEILQRGEVKDERRQEIQNENLAEVTLIKNNRKRKNELAKLESTHVKKRLEFEKECSTKED